MKHIKIKTGNSILQPAGQFHAFVLIFLQNAGASFYKTRKINFTNADLQFYFLRTSDFTKCGSVIAKNDKTRESFPVF